MLVKIQSVERLKVKVIELDIDELGSVIPLRELELLLPHEDDSIFQILNSSTYAALFTENDYDENNSIVVLVKPLSIDELNQEKNKMIDFASKRREVKG